MRGRRRGRGGTEGLERSRWPGAMPLRKGRRKSSSGLRAPAAGLRWESRAGNGTVVSVGNGEWFLLGNGNGCCSGAVRSPVPISQGQPWPRGRYQPRLSLRTGPRAGVRPEEPTQPLCEALCPHFSSSILVIPSWFNSKQLGTGRGEQACPPPRPHQGFWARVRQLPLGLRPTSAFWLCKGLFPPAAAVGPPGRKGRERSGLGASAGTGLRWALPGSHHPFFQQRRGFSRVFWFFSLHGFKPSCDLETVV